MLISLLHTTANRAAYEAAAHEWWILARDLDQVEHVVTFENSAFKHPPESPFPRHLVRPTRGTPVTGWNEAAKLAVGQVLVMVADDLLPSENWDGEIRSCLQNAMAPGDPGAVLWVTTVDRDGRKLWPDIVTHPVFTRAYYAHYRYFLHPAYYARFSDLEFTLQAQRNGAIVDARDKIVWQHEDHQLPGEYHPSTETINRRHREDERTYHARLAAGFPREWPAWRENASPV